MKTLLSLVAAAALVLALPLAVHAAPISDGSTINFTGLATFNNNSITFTNPADTPAAGETGDFTTFGGCTGCANFASPYIWNPISLGTIVSAINGAKTMSFVVDGQSAAPIFVPGSVLVIQDTGTAKLTGFDDTDGTIVLTLNEISQGDIIVSGSFSVTAAAVNGGGGGGGEVPEPMTLALLGTGLAGLGVVRKVRKA